MLASESERRKILLKMMGINALVRPSLYPEAPNGLAPAKQVLAHANAKAKAVSRYFANDCLVIGADTIVVIEKQVLGKPSSKAEAKEFLRLLSGRSHYVYSGICIIYNGQSRCAYQRSKVSFASLSEDEIEDYVKTDEPMDKAGAYGIQGFGAQFITDIKGDYFNVMGFPLRLFYQLCQEVIK